MNRARGFTLLEVLVALALTGLLVVLLFSGFRIGVRSWQLAQRHIESAEEGRQLGAVFYRHFNQIQADQMPAGQRQNGQMTDAQTRSVAAGQGAAPTPRTRRLPSAGESNATFLGEPSRIRYVAPLGMSAGGRPYLIELIDSLDGRGGIWMRSAPMRPDVTADELLAEAEPVRISAGLQVSFAYFGDPAQGWQTQFREVGLPRLVAVKLSGGGRDWPTISYALPQSASGEAP